MIDFLNTPYFGLIVSILSFEVGLYLYRKTKISLFNPLLISIALIIWLLSTFNINIKYYNQGGDLLSFFLGPATVILAVPLYKQFELLKSNLLPILVGIIVGCLSGIVSVFFLSKLFGLNSQIGTSLIPKSVTTPIGIEISKQIGGIPSITVAVIIATGIFGAVIGPFICHLFRVRDEVAVGIAIGTAAHAIGTTRAMELGETEGAMSSLAIGVAGLITVIIAPILFALLN